MINFKLMIFLSEKFGHPALAVAAPDVTSATTKLIISTKQIKKVLPGYLFIKFHWIVLYYYILFHYHKD